MGSRAKIKKALIAVPSLSTPAGVQLVWQQEDPLQEEHREVPGGGQHLRHEDGPGRHAQRRLAAHAKLHRSRPQPLPNRLQIRMLQLQLHHIQIRVCCNKIEKNYNNKLLLHYVNEGKCCR